MQKTQLLVLVLATLCAQSYAINAVGVVEVFAGVMFGVIKKNNLEELKGCMVGTDAMVKDIENAVENFSNGGVIGITAGIYDIIDFLL